VAGRYVPIRAVHFTEMRSKIQELWTQAGLGDLPEFSAGAIVVGSRSIKTSDPEDLRLWLTQYENSNYGQTRRARAYYEYDGYDGIAQYGRGRRTGMWDGCGRQATYYDQAGRVWREERTLDGTLYSSTCSYDAMNRVHQSTLPDNEVLTYSYGPNGLLSQMASSLGTVYLSNVAYNALNAPTSYTLGDTVSAQARHSYWGIDASGYPFGALKTIQLQRGSNPMLVDREMGYDQAGNVTSVNDRTNSEDITYTYDELDRLTAAGYPINESYGYNQIGNNTSRNGQTYAYTDPGHAHAVTDFAGATYAYDANGSMVARPGQTIRYNPEMRPLKVTGSGAPLARFAYDGDGVRRKRLDGKGTIHYLGSYERNLGNGVDTTEVVTKYYGALGRTIAFRKNGVLSYLGTDHLGGTVCTADSAFNPIDRMRYTPYGVSRDVGSSLNTDHRFTSQIEDASVGLYWYASRAYDPVLGRFCQPDTIVPGAANPQPFNRYSYVLGNPLGGVDPTGHRTYFIGGIGGNVDEVFQKFVEDLGKAGIPDPIGPVYAYREHSKGETYAEVVKRSLDPDSDPDARRLADRIVADFSDRPLPQGEQLNLIGLSGGATTAFNTARFLGQDVPINYLVTMGGVVLQDSKPNNVEHWISFWGGLDPLARLAPGADVTIRMPLTDHDSYIRLPEQRGFIIQKLIENGIRADAAVYAALGYPDEAVSEPCATFPVTATIPAEIAPGGVGVVDITSSNPSGGPAGGGSWDCPGGANAQADAAARQAAWERAGSPDYNALRSADVPGY
jgi:RHS repeat-associated protein